MKDFSLTIDVDEPVDSRNGEPMEVRFAYTGDACSLDYETSSTVRVIWLCERLSAPMTLFNFAGADGKFLIPGDLLHNGENEFTFHLMEAIDDDEIQTDASVRKLITVISPNLLTITAG